MAIGNSVTLVGNLTADPEMRFTSSGTSVCNFVLAITERVFDKTSNEWKDGDSAFVRCTVWKNAGAENVVDSLSKGSRAIVTGKWRQNTYTTDNNEKRTTFYLEVEEIGTSLRFAVAKPVKGGRPQAAEAPSSDPWASMPAPAAAGA
jgi:single-strand DNA-binding protein